MSRPKTPTITFRQAMGLVIPYVRRRLMEQVQSVALIILYLIFFQTMVLGIPIAEAGIIAAGLSLVVLGLMFFMEGLLLGLMPLGEVIGIRLPQKAKLIIILGFAFILGLGATFAEPAIGVLKDAGASVKAWDAPLLFVLLNKYSNVLVWGVGVGVGIAVVFGMLRFLRNWPLKTFIYVLIPLLSAMTAVGFVMGYFYGDGNLTYLTGLAWDCGAVTTGPVTVPLVLALGIGISRIVGGGDSGSGGGFGVVTLASLFPILTVLLLGFYFMGQVPKPMQAEEFFSAKNRPVVENMFPSKDAMIGYALSNSDFSPDARGTQPIVAAMDGDTARVTELVTRLASDEELRKRTFPDQAADVLNRWLTVHGSSEMRLAVFGDPEKVKEAVTRYAGSRSPPVNKIDLLLRNAQAALKAIIPLTIFMLLTLFLMREKLPRADEVILGILFAVVGMAIFNIGIELGLTKLGNQVGSKLPSSFTSIELREERTTLNNFDPNAVQTAITPKGEREKFFYMKSRDGFETVNYREQDFSAGTQQYTYTPKRGPLFGTNFGVSGIVVVLIFAFIMGYGATLAEPALNALGITVEEITVGTFRKALLMQAVAIGVGLGIALGVAKIIYDIPLIYLLVPPYLLLLFVTFVSTEEFVNIGWDSAGVTTGPITVPLVLAMGLGVGGQVPGVVEGFGILSMASVCPILSVLLVGLNVTKKRRAAIEAAEKEKQSEASGGEAISVPA